MAGRIPKSFIDELIARPTSSRSSGARHAEASGQQLQRALPVPRRKDPIVHREPVERLLPLLRLRRARHGDRLPHGLRQPRISGSRRGARGNDGARECRAKRARGRREPKDDNEDCYALLREADQIYRAALATSGDPAIAYLREARHRRPDRGALRHGICADAWTRLLRALGTSDARIATAPAAGLARRERHAAGATTVFATASCFRSAIAARPGHRLRRPRARLRRAEVSELAGDAGLPQGPRALRPLRGAPETPGRPRRSSSSRATSTSRASSSTASNTPSRRSARRRHPRTYSASRGSPTASCSASTAIAPVAPPRGGMETALPYGGGTVEIWFLLLPEKDDPDTFVRSQGPGAFRALVAGGHRFSDFLVEELGARRSWRARGPGDHAFKPLRTPLLKRFPRRLSRAAVDGTARRWVCHDLFRRRAGTTLHAVLAPPPDAQRRRGKRKTCVREIIISPSTIPRRDSRTAIPSALAA